MSMVRFTRPAREALVQAGRFGWAHGWVDASMLEAAADGRISGIDPDPVKRFPPPFTKDGVKAMLNASELAQADQSNRVTRKHLRDGARKAMTG